MLVGELELLLSSRDTSQHQAHTQIISDTFASVILKDVYLLYIDARHRRVFFVQERVEVIWLQSINKASNNATLVHPANRAHLAYSIATQEAYFIASYLEELV